MRRIVTLAAVAAALMFTQACAATAPEAKPTALSPAGASSDLGAAPSSPAAARPASPASTPAAAGGVLSGKRQVYFFPLDNGATVPDSVVSVTPSGRADITADFGDRALFVPVPTSPRSKQFLIKTGKLKSGGEPLCLQVKNNGSDPLTLATKACDAALANQKFQFQRNGLDAQDRMTYLISVNGLYLRYSPYGTSRYGLFVQEAGEGTDLTKFVIIDRGEATLPALD